MLGNSLWLFCTYLAAIGCGYALLAAFCVRNLGRRQTVLVPPAPGASHVAILKPLHGCEPDLAANLASFADQDHPAGGLQVVFGVQCADDPACAVVQTLIAARPGQALRLVIDPASHGKNAKVSNLINMIARAEGDVIILSDSDIWAPPRYLATVLAALAQPGTGAVSCLYRGCPANGAAASLWSRLSAGAIDWHFLPNVLVGLSTGMAKPCFGSTIAVRRETLERIGGLQRVKDLLADDYEIGRAVRELGLTVAIPPLVVGHTCTETSLAELWRHELRWARTIRLVDPWGYLGLIVTQPLPFALMGLTIGGWSLISLGMAALALVCRFALGLQVQHVTGGPGITLALMPLRDILSFGVFMASFWPGRLTWRGQRFGLDSKGRMTADAD